LERRRGFRAQAEDLDPPEPDQDARRLNKILAGGGALVSLVSAVLGSPEGAAAGEGLATGASRNLERRREAFRRRRQSFRESLRKTRRHNREVNLSINEARTRATESAIDAERQRQADQNTFERKKKLIKLRNRLDNDDQLSDAERRQLDKEIELLDQRIRTERQRGEAQAALAEKRRADAETNDQRSQGAGGDPNPYGNLSDDQLERLMSQTETVVKTGFPSSMDTDRSGTISQVERDQALLGGGSIPDPSDVSDAAERLSVMREEARRRGLIIPREEKTENRPTFLDDRPTNAGSPTTRRDSTRSDSSRSDRGRPGSNADVPGRAAGASNGAGSTGTGGRAAGGRSPAGSSAGAGEGRDDELASDPPEGQSEVVQRYNRILQNRGRVALIDTMRRDLKERRLTPRQGRALMEQIVPDSTLRRLRNR
jgi:hypothetical protein